MPAFTRLHRATAIVPLAVLSAAWTASLTGIGVGSASAGDAPATLPDGSTVPTQAIEALASVSSPTSIAPAAASGDTSQIIATASTSGIPSAALVAYQRAEAVINAADKTCEIPWQLIAAIGRVESDHGRFGGNTLSEDGVAQPGIYGVALKGLGPATKFGAAGLVMAIVGGAIMPLVQGRLLDATSAATSFIVPAICFVVVAAYAVFDLRAKDTVPSATETVVPA